MSELSDRLHADLTTAMKARDELRVSTLRLTLAAVRTQEVAGDVARELTDDEVVTVLRREDRQAPGGCGRVRASWPDRLGGAAPPAARPPAAQRTSITTGLPRFTVLPGPGTVRTTRPDPPYVVP